MTNQHPIIFSPQMITAIVAGKKTMTRRVVKPQPERPRAIYDQSDCIAIMGNKEHGSEGMVRFNWRHESNLKVFQDSEAFKHKCPYGSIGDTIWVKEPYAKLHPIDENDNIMKAFVNIYKIQWSESDYDCWANADNELVNDENIKWVNPRYMPKAAARIWLEITDIKVERVRDITEADAVAEGISGKPVAGEDNGLIKYPNANGFYEYYNPAMSFASLWQKINGKKYPWHLNPWVWVVSFKVISVTGMP